MRISVLGAGNMGGALIGGILKAGVAKPGDLQATTRSEASAQELRLRFAIQVSAGMNLEAAREADVVIVAVKPNVTPKVMAEIRDVLHEGKVLISLAAAVPISVLEESAGCRMPVFRAMPNIPVLVEEGAIGLCHNSVATAEHREMVEAIFQPVGVVCFVEEEQIDAVTALSGSGPAYIYMVIEAMMAAGMKMGLPRDVSLRLSEQTVLGAAKHAKESKLHPAILRDQVVTPGGTTIQAIHELERHGLRSMLISAIEAATLHSRKRTDALLKQLHKDE